MTRIKSNKMKEATQEIEVRFKTIDKNCKIKIIKVESEHSIGSIQKSLNDMGLKLLSVINKSDNNEEALLPNSEFLTSDKAVPITQKMISQLMIDERLLYRNDKSDPWRRWDGTFISQSEHYKDTLNSSTTYLLLALIIATALILGAYLSMPKAQATPDRVTQTRPDSYSEHNTRINSHRPTRANRPTSVSGSRRIPIAFDAAHPWISLFVFASMIAAIVIFTNAKKLIEIYYIKRTGNFETYWTIIGKEELGYFDYSSLDYYRHDNNAIEVAPLNGRGHIDSSKLY